jgi:hypothetical protein
MKLLQAYGGTQQKLSNGRTITFDETKLSSPSPIKESKKSSQKKKIEYQRKRTTSPKKKEFVETSNIQQHTTAKLVSSPEKPDSEWVTYLDSESQCYYEYNTINGESRWLTYEASQAIGIEKQHEIQSNY